MAKGYYRGSGGFMIPVGTVRSGRVSGPRSGRLETFQTGEKGLAGAGGRTTIDTDKVKGARGRLLASYEKRQAKHEATMNRLAKAKVDSFERINKLLNESKESDPKDKLGNTVPSVQTKYLEQQLLSMGKIGRGPTGPTPGQRETMRSEGPGGPGGGEFDIGGSRQAPGLTTPSTPVVPAGDGPGRAQTGETPMTTGTHPQLGQVKVMRPVQHPQTGQPGYLVRVRGAKGLKFVPKESIRLSTPQRRGVLDSLYDVIRGRRAGGGTGAF